MRIAIVGGGIGGLVLHLALRARGIGSTVFEQSAALAEIGAAVALSANATRELARLGVLPAVEAESREPSELIFRDGRTGERIAAHEVAEGGRYRAAYGFPYLGVHRAALQKALGEAVGPGPIRLGHCLLSLAETPSGTVRLRFGNGATHEADLVVGADGVRSLVRSHVAAGSALRYTGTSAFRGIIPRSELPLLPDPEAIQFWCGPSAHLLHYAIGPASDVNLFAVVEGPEAWPAPGASTVPTAPGEALAHFEGWHPAARQLVERIADKRRWGLVVTPRLLRWHRGPAVILGDAAHAMVPHHGQGANTTIEDAVVLANLLAAGGAPLEETLARFTALRRRRTALIQRSAWDTNAFLHLPDGDARLPERDERFATFPDRFGWIHAFRAGEATPGPGMGRG